MLSLNLQLHLEVVNARAVWGTACAVSARGSPLLIMSYYTK